MTPSLFSVDKVQQDERGLATSSVAGPLRLESTQKKTRTMTAQSHLQAFL